MRTMNKEIYINGIKVLTELQFSVEPEQWVDLDDFVEEDKRRIESGEIVVFSLVVNARAFGITGSDSLGNCTAFAGKVDESIDKYLNSYGLIDNATMDLTRNILDQAEQLKQLME